MSILKDIWNFVTGAAKKVKEALTFGKDFANKAKSELDKPIWDIVVAAIPGKYDDALLIFVRAGLKKLSEDLGWADKTMSDFSNSALPHVLNTISAESAYLKAEYEKVKLSRPQAIASAQVIYAPEIVKL
jgi:hypothetical protein